ncbi:LPPD [Symbiodinium necroappetens]|uniref:LPPD protein n=1 Tax=Symbiodinium necroappetens TaxID=1628268 RepID=A0A812TTQ8_9DINO|nr:LPPD [Symbiodinium necroappetens]
MRSLVLLLRALVTCTVSLICRQVAENLGADGEHPHSDEPGFRNILRRASAPAILVSSGQTAAPSTSSRAKKSVAFGLRYSIVIGSETFSEGRRLSDVEAQKKADAIQHWWAERQRLGYDAYNGDESPSPSPELPVRRPRSTSLAEMHGEGGQGDGLEVPGDLPSGRRRSRANFSAADICEDSASSFPPEGDFQMDGISRNDAPNLLQDFNLQVMPKPKPVVQSVEEFLAAAGATAYIVRDTVRDDLHEFNVALCRRASALLNDVGNAVKDAISAPRPDWKKGVRLVSDGASDGSSTDDMEYGLPSTHTINTVCMWLYIFYFYASSTSHGDGISVYWNTWRSPALQMMFCAILIWCTFIMYGRLYLGMHSPIDVVVGFGISMVLLHVYAAVDDFIDAWMTATTAFVPAYQLAFAVVLCWTYPQGLQRTPSYNYAVYFTGVCLGVVTGVWRCPHHHSVAAAEAIKAVRGPLASTGFMLFVGRRFLVGLVVVLALRAASKEILKLLVPRVFQILGIPCSDHEAKPKEEKDPVGFNVLTPTRLLNYAVVGWTVVEPCFDLFEWLRI